MLKTKEEIRNWLKKYDVLDCSINDDLTVNANSSVNLDNKDLERIEVQFNTVKGYFDCSSNRLVNLDGCPKEVGKEFWCYDNMLTTLEGSPEKVGGDFNCSCNWLISLEGSPKKIGEDFNCNFNNVKNLDFLALEIGGDVSFFENKLLRNLQKVKNFHKLKIMANKRYLEKLLPKKNDKAEQKVIKI